MEERPVSNLQALAITLVAVALLALSTLLLMVHLGNRLDQGEATRQKIISNQMLIIGNEEKLIKRLEEHIAWAEKAVFRLEQK